MGSTDSESWGIILPLGLSFFVFKAISFLADIYMQKIEEVSFLQSLEFLVFFAQIQSGPLARYKYFDRKTHIPKANIYDGITRFMVGFTEKTIFADVLAHVVTEVFDSPGEVSPAIVWLASICYSLQLYYDFAGYSNMAIGVCNMLGYDCPNNFNYPYACESISDFSRRWHITLRTWFRDYVYVPLGGSRVGRIRLIRNLFVVWILTGIWYGSGWNFVAWGIGYFIFLTIEKLFHMPDRLHNRLLKFAYRLIVLLLVNFQWVLFRSKDISQGFLFLKTMFCLENANVSSARAFFLLKDYIWFIVFAVVFAFPLASIAEKWCSESRNVKLAYNISYAIIVINMFVVALSFVVSGQNNPFLYGNF